MKKHIFRSYVRSHVHRVVLRPCLLCGGLKVNFVPEYLRGWCAPD